MINVQRVCETLSARYCVVFTGEVGNEKEGQVVSLRPADIPNTRGFSVRVLLGWRGIRATLVLDPYARSLVETMGAAGAEQKKLFCSFLSAIIKDGGAVDLAINGRQMKPDDPNEWPPSWQMFALSVERGQMVIDPSNPSSQEDIVSQWGGRLVGAVLALFELQPAQAEGEVEGAVREVNFDRYERSPLNRASCIEFHGSSCKICGFRFEKVYGEFGRGYIEVHHIEPLSETAGPIVVNPITDLIPLCSNCHSMIHHRKVALLPEELKAIVERMRAAEEKA